MTLICRSISSGPHFSPTLDALSPGQRCRPLGFCLHPPAEQGGKTLLPGIHRPVKLRRKIIQPAVGQPQAGIRVKFRVGVQAPDLRRIHRPPDAERTDAKLHPRFQRLDGLINAVDKLIDVGPPPVVPVEKTAAPPYFCQVAPSGNSRFAPRRVLFRDRDKNNRRTARHPRRNAAPHPSPRAKHGPAPPDRRDPARPGCRIAG